MSIGTHIAVGLIIGKISGDYTTALFSSLIVDIDHFIPYIKHKIIFKPKKLWKAMTSSKDFLGNQRNLLHSIFSWLLISAIILFINFDIGVIFMIGYVAHLFLDILDNSDLHLFYPIKYNIIGPIPYLSLNEFLIMSIIFVGYFFI